ncbi:FAD-binding oxidoreductase [Poseidonocella sedimentorum]|uniref:D-lactate dehydrogenase (cytochrome) n=1 Tax=Poseidonocella sedimentorum TaxID=871652 RepID=A0A1I6CX20_9RHOB|nr:FAD-linked oxidase C-terminal domain-containing protein [Poseidonocella sedimentorum]SFQ97748.1 D-lactate dehydrogenase (cytochrome) [Poseidonocella sedimentorum]
MSQDRQTVERVIERLHEVYGDRVQSGAAICEQHAHTTSWVPPQPPDAVVFPHSAEEISHIVKTCAAEGVPVVPFGAGTSLEGQVNAARGGISIDLGQMNAVVSINAEDMDCVVQPGVTRKQLNTELRDQGLFFPIDPGADASLGGMASTRASGTNAVRYGTMRDNILSLEAVMPNGEIIRTGARARKSSAGYDLARLLIGAEGTLGIITELTLRLHGIPEAVASATCAFPTVGAACDAVIATILMGVPVARIELLDADLVRAVNAYSKLSLAETPMLFLEFHGSEQGVAEQTATFAEIAADCGGTDFQEATSPEARSALWQARHDAYWAAIALRPGAVGFSTDVCVPISRLAEAVTAAQEKAGSLGLVAPIVGHVGDGNFHTLPLIDMNDEDERARAREYVSWLNELAISLDGTCTGEHGIGQGKMPYLRKELGHAVDVMAAIKVAIDPGNIMNPGKIFDI